MSCAANSRSQKVRAKMPRSSLDGSGSMSHAPSSSVGRKRTVSDDAHFGDRHDETPAGGAVFRLLAEDLLLEVPGEEQHVVRPIFEELLRRQDAQVRAGR